MIIAVPVSRGKLAKHFTKAPQIVFFNAEHQLLETAENPAMAGGCAAKKAMLNLIKSRGSTMVLVDQIGERMLGKLLATGAVISKGDSGQPLDQVLATSQDNARFLTAADQGRPSLNHAKKGGCGGGCGCGGHKSKEEPVSLMTPVTAVSSLSFSGFKKI
ncbi:dinitrogenase iron-molybdenum cofactor biosynthesis protein [Shewanella submarina]|uniref:NifB/NifX family molybdenum-iron cluster-binding protein n=1 Tax=Shewanella submarina TaxID=2016376 RepID=A0ABV7GBI8_9GAMM|nr:NifB/NifX family molybdenum-iron cluster-binding protein [Shewanella submarina]MCL1037429.1 dinitrogenase iron-molybdenum cofactor biosynthesis protein [Shewanella submarina]